MYQIGDRVLYGIHGICAVTDIQLRQVDRKRVGYYVLEPVEQPGAKFYVPTQNQAAVAKLRPMISKEELQELLRSDAVRQQVWIADEGQRKLRYRELINSGDRAALISMVGALYRHRDEQLAQGKKFHLCDENFLRDAVKLLNAEFTAILGMTAGQVEDYVRESLQV